MQTVIVGLFAGLVVGVICVAYVFFRTRKFLAPEGAGEAKNFSDSYAEKNRSESLPYSEEATSSGLMLMAVVGSGSLLWGFIGAGLYHIIRNDEKFFILSAIFAMLINVWIWLSKTTFTWDKILLSTFIILGLGALIPWLI